MSVEPLHDRAHSDLRFIRETMQHAAAFTGVPGRGGMLMGGVGVAATVVASRTGSNDAWLAAWLSAAVLGLVIGIWTMTRKARVAGADLFRGKGARFFLGLAPPLAVGGVLTLVLWRGGLVDPIPGVWLLLYGTATITGGAFSIRLVPIMGACFVALGLVAVFLPLAWGNWILGVGFGGLQIVFGSIIARNHGG